MTELFARAVKHLKHWWMVTLALTGLIGLSLLSSLALSAVADTPPPTPIPVIGEAHFATRPLAAEPTLGALPSYPQLTASAPDGQVSPQGTPAAPSHLSRGGGGHAVGSHAVPLPGDQPARCAG